MQAIVLFTTFLLATSNAEDCTLMFNIIRVVKSTLFSTLNHQHHSQLYHVINKLTIDYPKAMPTRILTHLNK